MVAEWSKTLVQIQLAISPQQTKVQIPLGTVEKHELILKKLMLHVNIVHQMVLYVAMIYYGFLAPPSPVCLFVSRSICSALAPKGLCTQPPL